MSFKICLFSIFILRIFGGDSPGTERPVLSSTVIYPPTITIEIIGPKNVTLPVEEVVLKTNLSIPESLKSNQSASYKWEVIEGTGLVEASAYDHPDLTLHKVKDGSLLVSVKVSYGNLTARAEHSLKLLTYVKDTVPPKAIIRPSGIINTVEGSILTLDAEGSSVPASPASFEWSQVSGPSVALDATNVAILKIENLPKGNFTFKVTVTDSQNRQDSTSVDVVAAEERDDPPKAVISECGTDSKTGTLTVRLPLEKLVLCGNTSSDDKGITSYKWFRVDDKLMHQIAVDLTGTQTSTLVLTNLQANEKVGPYQFQLDVTDAKGQSDSATVSVFVNEARNLAPVADAGGNRTILLPETSAVLEGNAKDDGSIKGYKWLQTNGPSNATIVNADQAKATVSGLVEGLFSFQLTVIDDGGLNGSDITYLEVKRGENLSPVIVVSNVSVSLPVSVALLDASKSHDDAGIVSWKWTPMEDVPASIVILGFSDSESVLRVSGLSSGIFRFNLTVKDQQGERDERIVWLHVDKGAAELESVEIFLKGSLNEFTVVQRSRLENRMASVLASILPDSSTVFIHVSHVEQVAVNGHTRMVFWAEMKKQQGNVMKREDLLFSKNIMSAQKVVETLRAENRMMDDYGIERIETLYCKLDCSNHGACSDFSKQCTCDRFWMSSLIGMVFNGGKHLDCAWSSVYFVIILIIVGLFTFFYFFGKSSAPMWRRRSRRIRRRRRYSPLHSEDSDREVQNIRKESKMNRNAPRLQPLPLPPSSDSLNSESDDLLPPLQGDWQNIELRERDPPKRNMPEI